MTNITKTSEKGLNKRFFSTLEDERVLAEELVIDPSRAVLERGKKDKDLRKFYEHFKKRSLYDRHKTSAYVAHFSSYVLSGASAYLSFPFLFSSLSSDVPQLFLRWGFVILALVANEFVKHQSINGAFKRLFAYGKPPLFSGSLFVVSVALSVYMCYNGVNTSNSDNYEENKPKKELFTSVHSKSIGDLKKANETLFKRSSWKGKLGGKPKITYSNREAEITRLSNLASKDIEDQYDTALEKFQLEHNRSSSVRQYFGFFVEGGIVGCSIFWLWFMFFAQREQTLLKVYSIDSLKQNVDDLTSNLIENLTPQPIKVSGFQAKNKSYDNSDKLTDKKLTHNINLTNKDVRTLLSNAKRDKKSYEGKLRKGIGKAETNISRIREFDTKIVEFTSYLNNELKK